MEANMMHAVRLMLVAAAVMTNVPVGARNVGQFGDVDPQISAWFKSVQTKSGASCCDEADGHRTDYRMEGDRFMVPIDGKWYPVPPDAVLSTYGNPFLEGVVWYVRYQGEPYIRCFVPGGGA
jgi:hypothetical protein